ncbi:MAG: hypothetical protein KC649_05800 [Candidatus Omnitrophica bacterium]|nr:hypothetical protein [Candidatus Omnitrophota bacterium]
MSRFSKSSQVITLGCLALLLGTPMAAAEPNLTVQTQMQSGHRFEVRAFVEWDAGQQNDILVKEAVFPRPEGAELIHQSEKSKSFAGPLGARASKEFTAVYQSSQKNAMQLGKIEVLYSTKLNPDEFKTLSSEDIRVQFPGRFPSGNMLAVSVPLAAAAFGLMLVRHRFLKRKKRVLPVTPAEAAGRSLAESIKMIYEANPKGYYKALNRILDDYEPFALQTGVNQEEFDVIRKEAQSLREKTGYAGVRTDWETDKKFHERVVEYLDSQKEAFNIKRGSRQ